MTWRPELYLQDLAIAASSLHLLAILSPGFPETEVKEDREDCLGKEMN